MDHHVGYLQVWKQRKKLTFPKGGIRGPMEGIAFAVMVKLITGLFLCNSYHIRSILIWKKILTLEVLAKQT